MNKEIISKIEKFNVEITPKKLNDLEVYKDFLKEYNSHTNLTTIIDDNEIYLKHFYDSLTIAQEIDFNECSNLLDIGTGAGFPGMVLKIMYPHLRVTLLDSNNKKTKFLEQLAQKLNLEVEIINERAEEFLNTRKKYYDIVTSRAVAYVDIISSLALPFTNSTGLVVLMKGNINNEILILKQYSTELNIKEYKIVDVSYENNERNLIILKKKNDDYKILNYSQLIKRNKKWKN